MLPTIIGLIRFGFSLLFGVAVSVLFAGIEPTWKNRRSTILFCIFFLIIQTICWWFFGLDLTSKLYPLITHLPLIFIFSIYYRRPWLISAVSVLSGYLCCQTPRWIGFLAGAFFGNILADQLFYIAAVYLSYYFIKRYVAESIRQLIGRSNKSCMLLGGVPLFYYLFDYVTTIYTDVLYQGAEWAVQFMPSIISIFYFVFVILYYTETQKQAIAQRERDMLDIQLKQAQTEFASMREIQQNAAAYRHDMRHHITLLQGFISEGRINALKDYLQIVQSDIDDITPVRFCENDTINLILSAFASKAKQLNIRLTIAAKLPNSLPFSDTELCSLLSNALENAIHASEQILDSSKRLIQLRVYTKNSKLCIDIRNIYQTEPSFQQGIPIAKEPGHGFGTKSMAHIVEKHGGVYQFSVKDGWFIFQATA